MIRIKKDEFETLVKNYITHPNDTTFVQIFNLILPYIQKIVNRYHHFFPNIPKEDLIEEATTALYKSLNGLKKIHKKSSSVVLYIMSTIKREVSSYVFKNLTILSIPYSFFRRIKKILNLINIENKPLKQISKQLKLELWEIRDYLTLWPKGVVYLDSYIDEFEEHVQHEIIQDKKEPTVDTSIMQKQQREYVYQLLSELPLEEREVIELRFGLRGNKCHTFKDISLLLGIPSQKVKEIERIALRKLKKLCNGTK